jgi:hypothetical protein
MDSSVNHVADLIFGRWRSQILYTGVELGIFDHLDLAPLALQTLQKFAAAYA